jgi:DnaK suppressor protein
MMIDHKNATQRLESRKRELEDLSDLSQDGRSTVELDQQSVGRLSRMDAMQQQAMNQATERARQRDLARIQSAFSRMNDDEYGYCSECGDEIPDGRLAIDPMAERCIKCAN